MMKIVRNLALLAMMIAYMAIPRSARAQYCDCSYCVTSLDSCVAACNGDTNCINSCSAAFYSCTYYCYLPCVY